MSLMEWVELLRDTPPWVGGGVLFLGALIEYVFPPFPGDTVVVAGAALVTAFGWQLWPVLGIVTAGSVAGSMVSWAVGCALARADRRRLRVAREDAPNGAADRGDDDGPAQIDRAAGSAVAGDRVPRRSRTAARSDGRVRQAMELLAARFERHGAAYLALNRFTPGIRTLFFVAAGWVGIGWRETMFWSAVSAAAWNGLLVGLGVAVGDNLALLELWLARYAAVVSVIVALVIAWNGWRVWRAVRGNGRA